MDKVTTETVDPARGWPLGSSLRIGADVLVWFKQVVLEVVGVSVGYQLMVGREESKMEKENIKRCD